MKNFTVSLRNALSPAPGRSGREGFIPGKRPPSLFLPWKDYTVERKEDMLLALRDERYMGLVPSGGVICGLTAGVDTQNRGFYYEIRAWGWGMNLESWQIRFGYVETFEALEEILISHRYLDEDGR